jgi:zona occludens toxin (predicted ATPase)
MNIKLTPFSIFLILLFVLVISSICWNCFIIEGFPKVATTEEVKAADAVADTAEAESAKNELIAAGVPATTIKVPIAAAVGATTVTLDNPDLKPGDVIVTADGKSYKISSNAITST